MIKNKCPATGKTKYISESDANEAMVRIKNINKLKFKNKRSTGKSNQKRSYFCKHCNGFHLTSIITMNSVIKKHKNRNKIIKEFFKSIDVEAWKANSIPFDQGHIPPPRK